MKKENRVNKKAVVLLSGGLDSSTTLAIAVDEGYEVYVLSFSYGQRNVPELEAAKKIVQSMNIKQHKIIDINLSIFGGSALTGDILVPKHSVNRKDDEIPITYVPARNLVFLSLGIAMAEPLSANDIFIGVNAVDYSGYPDCRAEFIESFNKTANLATKAGAEGNNFKVHTPLINLRKSEIIRRGLELGVDYSMTISCYDPSPEGLACGECDSCQLRRKGFQEAGISDPTRYKN